jgi:hypothetical protein
MKYNTAFRITWSKRKNAYCEDSVTTHASVKKPWINLFSVYGQHFSRKGIREMKRTAYFFKVNAIETVVENGQNVDKEFDLTPIFSATLSRRPLPNHTTSNAMPFAGNYLSLSNMPLPSTNREIYGQFYHLKKKIRVMKNNGVSDITADHSLLGTDHQVEIANFIYFPQKNCIALEYNHFMPRYHIFASYLQQLAVALLSREITIQLSFISRKNPVAEVNGAGAVTRLDIDVYASAAKSLPVNTPLLAAISAAAAPFDGQVKLSLGYQRSSRGRGESIPFSKADIAAAWSGAQDVFEAFTANVESEHGMRSVNFVDDYARGVWEVQADGTIVSSADLFVKIREHYTNFVDSII